MRFINHSFELRLLTKLYFHIADGSGPSFGWIIRKAKYTLIFLFSLDSLMEVVVLISSVR